MPHFMIIYLFNLSWKTKCLFEVAQLDAQPAGVAQLDAQPTGDQEVAGSTPARLATFFYRD